MSIEDSVSAAVSQSDESSTEGGLRMKIIGLGGAGNNAVDRLKLDQLDRVHLAAINTDAQILNQSPVEEKLLIGRSVTRGLSAGGESELGHAAALEDRELIKKVVEGTDLIFLLAGLGGGTGSGAAPVVAEVAAESGALVIAFVTIPFSREGSRRLKQAEDALQQLRNKCHAVIALPNDLLLQQIDENATVMEAFAIADEWVNQGVRSIWSMIFQTGLINVDFATLKRSLSKTGGRTLFGTGFASGEDYVARALHDLEICPLLHLPENRYVKRTDSLIVNIAGGPDLTMARVHEVMDYVSEKFGCKDSLVLGAVIDGAMRESLRITVLGTTEMANPAKGYRSVPAASTPKEGRSFPTSNPSTPSSPRGKNKLSSSESQQLDFSDQEEFAFAEDSEQRGFFEQTRENLYDGEDLDIPTFFRRGIRVQL